MATSELVPPATGLPPVAARARSAKRSAIREVFDLANRIPGAIRLEIGEPSFTTPAHIIEGAAAAARSGSTRYGPNGGLDSLRELLADKIGRVDGYQVDPSSIVVTPGAMNALFSSYLALLDLGDEVLLPTPGYPNMDEMVTLLGGQPVFYPLTAAAGYVPDIEQIESLVSPRTKAIFVNTPSNPAGAVFPRQIVEQLVQLAERRGIWMIYDEVYDELVLSEHRQHVSAASISASAPIISVYSFSKVYAMTGWRVGYCAAPPELAAIMRKLQEPQVSCPSTISQKAAEAALTGPREPIDAMRDAYVARRDRSLLAARRLGLSVSPTDGTFYMLIDISACGQSSRDFTMRLLRDASVAVAPGEVFGPGGNGLVRISLAREPDEIEEGMHRIAATIATMGDEPSSP
jgi:aspartate/methionine/tyrosine aminotransferase